MEHSFDAIRQFLITGACADEPTADQVAACLSALQQGHTATTPTAVLSNAWMHEGAIKSFAVAEQDILTWVEQAYQCENDRLVSTDSTAMLSAEQAAAVAKAVGKKLFLLEGGPGTGKTFCAAEVIHRSAVNKWLALAPTGKAKAQLEASLHRQGLNVANVMTLQGALARETRPTGFFNCELILVDESSMIDTLSFRRLLRAISANTRLILLGDRYQLPPVGPGQPFYDLCVAYQERAIHQRLHTSHRTAVAALKQRADALLQHGQCSADRTLPTAAAFTEQVLNFHRRTLPHNPTALMASLTERMVLGALQEGPWGAQMAASVLADCSVDDTHPWRPLPILILTNAESIDLWNGDLGWLCRPHSSRPFALFSARHKAPWSCDGGYRRIPLEALPPWAPAWVMTVHKSQGSEFDAIAIVLPPGSESFGKPLLYTALTRAKSSAEIWATREQLKQTCMNAGLRDTLLHKSLQNIRESI